MTENDLSDEEKGSLKEFRELLRKDVTSWSDFYRVLGERVREFQKAPSQQTMMQALYLQRAFLLALEDMPEEGDILVLVDRTAFIALFDSARLGARLYYGRNMPNVNVLVIDKEVLDEFRKEAMMGEEEVAPPPSGDSKKFLH